MQESKQQIHIMHTLYSLQLTIQNKLGCSDLMLMTANQ